MKVLAILAGLMIASLPAFAASELSDSEMSGVYAGNGPTFAINDVDADNSAVAAQSNIGVIAGEGDVYKDTITNTNLAPVVSNLEGCSAVALQNNIGAAASLNGDLDSVTITNTNVAEVDNVDYVGDDGCVSGSSLMADECVGINIIDACSSAVALQNNIAAIYSDGYAVNSTITNVNSANVLNTPGPQ